MGTDDQTEFGETVIELKRYREGDSSAFDRLYARYGPKLEFLVARKISRIGNTAVRSQLDAKDILQEAMKTVLETLPQFEYRGPGSLFRWMEAIAGHKVSDHMDYWETKKRRKDRERPLKGEEIIPRQGPGPLTMLGHEERSAMIAAAVESLEEQEYRIVTMRHFFGATWEEIAKEVGATNGEAVRRIHNRVVPRLKPLLRGLS